MGDMPAVVAISGVKNSGKTTFLEHLIPILRERGLRVGVIKHDGHAFVPDVPDTDSFRLRESGAEAVAVVSSGRWMLVKEEPLVNIQRLLGQLENLDIVLLEGFKDSGWPKIELVRKAVSQSCVCSPDTLLAVATDMEDLPSVVPLIPLEGYTQAAECICGLYFAEEGNECVKGQQAAPLIIPANHIAASFRPAAVAPPPWILL